MNEWKFALLEVEVCTYLCIYVQYVCVCIYKYRMHLWEWVTTAQAGWNIIFPQNDKLFFSITSNAL